MLTNNKPRGISLNKNAANIKATALDQQQVKNQLHHSPSEPLPPKLRFNLTRNTQNVAQENLIQINDDPKDQQPDDDLKKEKKPLKPLSSAFVSSQNDYLFQLAQSQFLLDAGNQNLQPLAPALQPLQPSLQPIPQQQQENQQLQPQPPKLYLPTTKPSATSHLLKQQQELLKQQNESLTSRIPRLSLRFSVLPPTGSSSATGGIANVQKEHLSTMAELAEDAMSVSTSSTEDEEIEDIDKSTSRDAIFQVSEIVKDIYEYMYDLERQQAIREDYLKEQKILTPARRQRLVNWCIDIHSQLRLLPETLYTTVMLIDRYFDQVILKQQSQLLLVAVGATLIASKYEEIYPPDIGDLIHLAENAYTRREIMRIEIQILEQLDFNLGKPIPLAFLRRFSKAAKCASMCSDEEALRMHSIAKYLMELSLNEYECCHWKPSLLAAASLYVAIHLCHHQGAGAFSRGGGGGGVGVGGGGSRTNSLLSATSLTRQLTAKSLFQPTSSNQSTPQDRWNKTLVHYTHYTKAMLQGPAGTLCKILKRSQEDEKSYTCVKKYKDYLRNAKCDWSRYLRTSRVDELIKSGGQSSM